MALIRRGKHKEHFTVLPNASLRDDALSYRARGVLAEILSRQEWHAVSADDLAERAKARRGQRGEGRQAMRAVFEELEQNGYLHRWKFRGRSGQIKTLLVFYDEPTPRGEPPRLDRMPPGW